MRVSKRIISLILVLAIVVSVCPVAYAASDENSASAVIADTSSVAAWRNYFAGKGISDNAIQAFWSRYDVVFSRVGYGAYDSLAAIEQKSQQLQSTAKGVLMQYVDLVTNSIVDLFSGPDIVAMYDSTLGVYRPYHVDTSLWVVSSMGYFPYFKPADSASEGDSQGGGKWIGSKSCDINGKVVILTADVLSNLCLTLNQAGETCSLTKWGDKYLVIAKDQYFYYCNPEGIPYVYRVDQNYAVDSPNNYYTNNEGDNVYNGGDTVNNNLIDNSSSTIWFPDGTLQYIDQLIYDDSTKTYYVDAHEEYNTTNNTYVSNTYQYEYHIDYTSITYIGATAEYDEEYHLYYELPDGRSSADLTPEDLEVLNVSMDVIPYVRSADDTSIRALYHFDGDTLDSSYWSYTGNLEWIKGASITYMEANAFNGALYLDENEHEFIVHLPGNLLSSDFTIQFRYYQSETKAPKSDSNIYIGDQLRLIFTGAEFIGSSGSLVSTSIGHWQDVCMMRKSGTLYYFINGVCYGSVADSTVYGDQLKFTFGSTQQTYKYLDELRILNTAAYNPSGYTPSSVPFDTNLSLVLPDTVTPVADEYWKFNADGNLFIDYNWDGDCLRPSFFKGGGWRYTSSSLAVPELMSGFVRLSTDSTYIPSGVLNGEPVDGYGIHFSLGNWTGAGGYFNSSPFLSSDIHESGYYTFTIMLADGTVCSVTACLSSINAASGVFSYLPNGAAIRLSRSSYGDGDSYSFYASIYPPPQGSMDIVYVELKEGSSANTGHEFVSAVAAIESEDIDKATLAVRTDLDITGYQIGGVRPSLPTKGLVWALVEAGRITSLQIYNGQAWEEVDGRIWTGSRWVPYYAFDVLLLKDMYDVVESDPTQEPIYTESGFWAWLQGAWREMIRKLDLIIVALGGDPGGNPDICDHEYTEEVTSKETCDLPGEVTYTCKLCEHTYKKVIKATGHDWTVSGSVSDDRYIYAAHLGECTDPSRDYVLPDGYIYSWGDLGQYVRLPEEYQELEWIGVTGSQWVNVGYSPQTNDVVYEVKWLETNLEKSACIFASTLVNYDLSLGNRFSGNIYRQSESTVAFSVGHVGDRCKYTNMAANVWNTLRLTLKDGLATRIVNGSTDSFNYTGSIVNGVDIGLFATNRDTNVHEYCKFTRMSFWRMMDGGKLVREMIPCRRKSDNVLGMYDTVSGAFFGNAGTGVFEGGPEVFYDDNVYGWVNTGIKYDDSFEFVSSPDQFADPTKKYVLNDMIYFCEDVDESLVVPEGYQEIEWIRFSAGQYIDTGIVPSDHMIEVKYDSEIYNNDEHLFGTDGSSVWFHFTLYKNKYYWGGDGSVGGDGGAWSTGIKTLIFNSGDNHEVIHDNVILGSGLLLKGNKNLFLGRRSSKANFEGLYFYARVTDRSNGTLVADFVPCQHKADGRIGMYDLVSGVFFENAGTGSFEAGPAVHRDPIYVWSASADRFSEIVGVADELTCAKCGATAKDRGDGPVDVVLPGRDENEDSWSLLDVLGSIKDGAWSVTTGIVRVAFGGLSGFVSGVSDVGRFFDSYRPNHRNEIFGIFEYKEADLWD